jgi:hypothetical protein
MNAGQTGKEEAGLTGAGGHIKMRFLKDVMHRRISQPHRRRTLGEQPGSWTLVELNPPPELQFKVPPIEGLCL